MHYKMFMVSCNKAHIKWVNLYTLTQHERNFTLNVSLYIEFTSWNKNVFKTLKAIVLDTFIFNVFYDNMLYSRVHNKVLCYYVLKRIPKLGLWLLLKFRPYFFYSVFNQEEHSWAWYSVTCAHYPTIKHQFIFFCNKKSFAPVSIFLTVMESETSQIITISMNWFVCHKDYNTKTDQICSCHVLLWWSYRSRLSSLNSNLSVEVFNFFHFFGNTMKDKICTRNYCN